MMKIASSKQSAVSSKQRAVSSQQSAVSSKQSAVSSQKEIGDRKEVKERPGKAPVVMKQLTAHGSPLANKKIRGAQVRKASSIPQHGKKI